MNELLMRAAELATLALLAVNAPAGDIYKSTDSRGHMVYSDHPSPGPERINIQSNAWDPQVARARAARELADFARAEALRKQEDDAKEAAKAQQKRAEEARREQCRRARDGYVTFSQARRPYRYGARGERVYYSASEIDAERESAAQAIKELCDDAANR